MQAEASASSTRGPSADHTCSRGKAGRAAPTSGRDSLVHSLLWNLVACLRHALGLALPLVDSHDRRKGHSITSILRLPWGYWQLPDGGGDAQRRRPMTWHRGISWFRDDVPIITQLALVELQVVTRLENRHTSGLDLPDKRRKARGSRELGDIWVQGLFTLVR